MQPELAGLLQRRLDGITDPAARLAMEVRRGRLLLEVGDREAARQAFESALRERPDDADALSAFTDLCVAEKDWDAAEQSLVRLARLLPTPEEQRNVYERLGDLYSTHLVNLARAEVALKEVLKRAPDDVVTVQKLVDVYKRQNDAARAAELQEDLIRRARSPEEKRQRVLELAAIHEQTAHDNRRAEQTLEAARREFPQDVSLLRALAEFYARHHQTPAVNILLDRAGADARRALVAGRFTPASFEVLAAVSELRGKTDAARVTQAMLAALEGRPSQLQPAGERAFDPRLDDVLAPDVLTAAMRALLSKTGDALDAAAPLDLRTLQATTMPADAPLARMASNLAASIGLGGLHVLVSPKLGKVCLPATSKPPSIVVGAALSGDERVAAFLVSRALKLLSAKASCVRAKLAERPGRPRLGLAQVLQPDLATAGDQRGDAQRGGRAHPGRACSKARPGRGHARPRGRRRDRDPAGHSRPCGAHVGEPRRAPRARGPERGARCRGGGGRSVRRRTARSRRTRGLGGKDPPRARDHRLRRHRRVRGGSRPPRTQSLVQRRRDAINGCCHPPERSEGPHGANGSSGDVGSFGLRPQDDSNGER